MPSLLEDFQRFLDESPTAWHAVQEVGNRLASLDFTPLEEGVKWELERGKRYFVQRGGSICAFALPEISPVKMTILGAHTDSPALKLKPNPEIHIEGNHLLSTEVYGGPILNSWLNRDLAIAGRVVVENDAGELEEKLVFLDETPAFIPALPIHLDKEINEKGMPIDKQDHLRPIFSLQDGKDNLLEPILKKHIYFKSLLAFDLFLVPLEKARFLGTRGEMLASYRLDNLSSAYACITALASASLTDTLQLAALWDGEEIGSRTSEGASSPFVEDIIRRITAFYNLTEEEYICLKTASLCISVDVAHAYNPNFAKKYDPQHQLIAGRGIAIKYNADKKYVTDAKTAAYIIAACRKLSLPYQSFVSRSNISSGSTIGPIFAHTMGIPTVDIGCPIFSMHSAREVLAVQDQLDMCQLLTHLL